MTIPAQDRTGIGIRREEEIPAVIQIQREEEIPAVTQIQRAEEIPAVILIQREVGIPAVTQMLELESEEFPSVSVSCVLIRALFPQLSSVMEGVAEMISN